MLANDCSSKIIFAQISFHQRPVERIIGIIAWLRDEKNRMTPCQIILEGRIEMFFGGGIRKALVEDCYGSYICALAFTAQPRTLRRVTRHSALRGYFKDAETHVVTSAGRENAKL